jgi:hypothetical protein
VSIGVGLESGNKGKLFSWNITSQDVNKHTSELKGQIV